MHHTDHGPMDLGQYNSLGEYCGPHTAFSVFLVIFKERVTPLDIIHSLWGPDSLLHGRVRPRSQTTFCLLLYTVCCPGNIADIAGEH